MWPQDQPRASAAAQHSGCFSISEFAASDPQWRSLVTGWCQWQTWARVQVQSHPQIHQFVRQRWKSIAEWLTQSSRLQLKLQFQRLLPCWKLAAPYCFFWLFILQSQQYKAFSHLWATLCPSATSVTTHPDPWFGGFFLYSLKSHNNDWWWNYNSPLETPFYM